MDENKIINNEKQDEAGKALYIQKVLMNQMNTTIEQQRNALNNLEQFNNENRDNLLNLIKQADILLQGERIEKVSMKDEVKLEEVDFNSIDTIPINENVSWEEYLKSIHTYANNNHINLNIDPYAKLLTEDQKSEIIKRVKEDYTMQEANCDKYDYAIATFSGVVSGVIDSLFVGMPAKSKLGDWTDTKTDNTVIRFAELITGEKFNESKSRKINGKIKEVKPIALAIEALEKKFPVHYDQGTGSAAGSLFDMSLSNHHIKSLSHSPSPIGMLFSVIDQISGTSHFLDNGRLITYAVPKEKTLDIRGNNLISNIFYGIVTWLGHIMSDIAGSYSTRANDSTRRGTGVPIPGYELLQLIGKKYDNEIDILDQKKSIADLSVEIFQRGYDFRFGMAQSIPVVLNELLIRLGWSLKQKYYHDKEWEECVPFGGNKPELRRMLLTGHGVLCIIDGLDAGIRASTTDKVNVDTSKNPTLINFILRLNYMGWNRLAISGMIEIRALYNEHALDLNALDEDLEKEWLNLQIYS